MDPAQMEELDLHNRSLLDRHALLLAPLAMGYLLFLQEAVFSSTVTISMICFETLVLDVWVDCPGLGRTYPTECRLSLTLIS